MNYTYTLNELGAEAIRQFVLDRGQPELNLQAYMAAAEVEADNFNEGGSQRGQIEIDSHCSKDGLTHTLLLEKHWFATQPVPETPEEDSFF
ncbi:hypothetical protein MJ863_13050 [Alcaligenes ammonioxydans]|jgi:hypothetical protein|uniref:Uncharacterized protein n=1 Tax=Alcaligenes ammonioxydans TaxID=2582914 RepID=A0ABX8SSK9_9BURK|nr:hypothetical protein [Alcaligenes ammonioxydans]EJC61459.1 hypothetical protein QWA_14407 [Alcaligenes faecalis subsp. faecalis NCIB 8687]MBX7021227.1 hypothetical protein [Providencia rettgeri]QBH20562.1 hypothetical protein EYC51_14270 [Alcaligenes faecalis]MCH1880512.1 hypothetical protein [Alcaligenes ammonioxydans]QXX78634.1 hypothetical protein FE795_06155 [Alcaligenes ammonioxydans]